MQSPSTPIRGVVDLITFDSLSIDHNKPGAAERAIFLSNEIDLSN